VAGGVAGWIKNMRAAKTGAPRVDPWGFKSGKPGGTGRLGEGQFAEFPSGNVRDASGKLMNTANNGIEYLDEGVRSTPQPFAGGANGGLKLTAHGAERIAGASATRGGVLSVEGIKTTKSLGQTFTQADGANVFLHEVTPGRFNAVIQNQNTGRIITTMENWSLKSIKKIGKNYGWPIK